MPRPFLRHALLFGDVGDCGVGRCSFPATFSNMIDQEVQYRCPHFVNPCFDHKLPPHSLSCLISCFCCCSSGVYPASHPLTPSRTYTPCAACCSPWLIGRTRNHRLMSQKTSCVSLTTPSHCSQSLPSSLNGDGAPLASCRVGCKSMLFSNHAKKP